MSILAFVAVGSVIAIGIAVYQLVKGGKAVTAASVEATVKADAATVKSDVKKV
jgi:hypothetical protein